MKIALYTAIYGNKDKLVQAPSINGVETILFTDKNREEKKKVGILGLIRVFLIHIY